MERPIPFLCRDADLLSAFEPIADLSLMGGNGTPVGDGIVHVGHAGPIDEVFVIGKRHFRVLGIGICGEEGAGPAEGSLGSASHKGIQHRAATLTAHGGPDRSTALRFFVLAAPEMEMEQS
jgi:hypothetical protein